MYALVIGRAYPNNKTGMIGIFEFEQAVALSKYGSKVVYSFSDNRSIKRLMSFGPRSFKVNDVPIYGYNLPVGGTPQKVFSSVKNWCYEKVLNEIIKDEGIPEIIHVHFPLLNLNHKMWDLLKKLKRPIVVTEHWTKVQIKSLQPQQITLLNKIVNEADAFICVGDLLKKSVLELTNTNRDIKVIPNMVKPIFFYEETKQKSEQFEFIMVGRLEEVKRFSLVIDAFSKAFKDVNEVHLNLVGDGPLYEKLQQQITELDMKGKITMHGLLSRNETAKIMKKSDAFVSGSILETFGVPFIEAMACGKPVIGIKNGPIDKYINNSNGILFQQDDLDSLTNALTKLYDNKGSFDGRKISETAYNIFSEEAVVKQLNDLFLSCLDRYSQ
ncbi:glycosyltransferase [Alteribacter aurantiacus]|uniref:glycosyltransferase n=1 Tax=Alteribacter aurantiacus TaxID=254410 RepID=UPI0004161885|nr:glycosyltransferase [Alteribacter aurantiacus]